jgi:hypothetical protein
MFPLVVTAAMVLLLLFMCYIIILQEHAQALALDSILGNLARRHATPVVLIF